MFVTLSCPQTQQNKFVNWQGDAEFRGEDFTATVTLGNPDLLVGSGMSSLSTAVEDPVYKCLNNIQRLEVFSVS